MNPLQKVTDNSTKHQQTHNLCFTSTHVNHTILRNHWSGHEILSVELHV